MKEGGEGKGDEERHENVINRADSGYCFTDCDDKVGDISRVRAV